jgi:undecaprenyl-diphosphatase
VKPASLVLALLVAAGLVVLRRRLSRTRTALGALVAASLVVHGTGVVRLPDLEDTAREVGPTLGPWIYLVVGVMAFLETGFFVGLVAPGELSVVLGGFVAGQGEIDVYALGAIVFVCAAAGDTTSYVLGRRLGRGFLLEHGRGFGVDRARLEAVERFFERNGAKTILVGRFLGVVRALAPFVAGASNVRARRFLPIDYLAAALWTITFVSLGYVFWQSFDTVVSVARSGALALGALVTLGVAGVVAAPWLDRAENRARLRDAWRRRSLGPLRDRT